MSLAKSLAKALSGQPMSRRRFMEMTTGSAVAATVGLPASPAVVQVAAAPAAEIVLTPQILEWANDFSALFDYLHNEKSWQKRSMYDYQLSKVPVEYLSVCKAVCEREIIEEGDYNRIIYCRDEWEEGRALEYLEGFGYYAKQMNLPEDRLEELVLKSLEKLPELETPHWDIDGRQGEKAMRELLLDPEYGSNMRQRLETAIQRYKDREMTKLEVEYNKIVEECLKDGRLKHDPRQQALLPECFSVSCRRDVSVSYKMAGCQIREKEDGQFGYFKTAHPSSDFTDREVSADSIRSYRYDFKPVRYEFHLTRRHGESRESWQGRTERLSAHVHQAWPQDVFEQTSIPCAGKMLITPNYVALGPGWGYKTSNYATPMGVRELIAQLEDRAGKGQSLGQSR